MLHTANAAFSTAAMAATHTTGCASVVPYQYWKFVLFLMFSPSSVNLHNVCHKWTQFLQITDFTARHEYAIKIHPHVHTSKSTKDWAQSKMESKKELWIMVLNGLKLEATHPYSTCFDTLIKNAAVFIACFFILPSCWKDDLQVNLLNIPACNCVFSGFRVNLQYFLHHQNKYCDLFWFHWV